MTEREAWAYVAEEFRNVVSVVPRGQTVWTKKGQYQGVCPLIMHMWRDDLITDGVKHRMLAKVYKLPGDIFKFPCTRAGAKQRVAFAEKHAK